MRIGFECNWLYPWRGRNVRHFIFPLKHKVECLSDAAVSRPEMANWTSEIWQRTGPKRLTQRFLALWSRTAKEVLDLGALGSNSAR